jgi:hypothetical protein
MTQAIETRPVVLTGEELLVFAASRQLPVPAGLEDLDVVRMSGELLEQRLIQAGRSLMSRGVSPVAPAEDAAESPLAQQLTTICQPQSEFTLVLSQGGEGRVFQLACGADNVLRSWDGFGMQLITSQPSANTEDDVLRLASLPESTGDEPGCLFSVPAEEFKTAAEAGEVPRVKKMLAVGLKGSDGETSWAPALAQACVNGPRGTLWARSHTAPKARATTLLWLDAASAGLWSCGGPPGGEANEKPQSKRSAKAASDERTSDAVWFQRVTSELLADQIRQQVRWVLEAAAG